MTAEVQAGHSQGVKDFCFAHSKPRNAELIFLLQQTHISFNKKIFDYIIKTNIY